MVQAMSPIYQSSISHNKAARVAVPPMAGLVLVWSAREFLGMDIPADVALALMTCAAYALEWARNRRKHRGRR